MITSGVPSFMASENQGVLAFALKPPGPTSCALVLSQSYVLSKQQAVLCQCLRVAAETLLLQQVEQNPYFRH